MIPVTSAAPGKSLPKLPERILESCPVQDVRVGKYNFDLAVVQDIDPLLDFYSDTQPANDKAIPYFAVLWDSALALAEYLIENFTDLEGQRVVELGCGLGLPSIVAARLGAKVLATDFHPDCAAFLQSNAKRNKLDIEFQFLDWQNLPCPAPSFDLVLASDVIYHPATLPHLVAASAKLCSPKGQILFSDPGRAKLQEAIDLFAATGFDGTLFAVRDIFVFELKRSNKEDSC